MISKTTITAPRIISAILRAAEIVCGSVVLVLMALFLRNSKDTPLGQFPKETFISIGISGISVVIALLFLPSFSALFRYFVLDLALSVMWFVTFALLLIAFTKMTCQQALAAFGALATGGVCNSQRAAWGFAFLSGVLWFVSFLVGYWGMRRDRKEKAKKVGVMTGGININYVAK